jgi:hypothetical protein
MGFQGVPTIRKMGVNLPYTKDQVEEIGKCARDVVYFLKTYVWITALDYEKKVLFNPREYQIKMINAMMNGRFVISRWPRQCGKTKVVAGFLLWLLIFNQNYSILIAAHQADKAREILGDLKDMFADLPPWLQHGVIEWNKGNIKLENGSRVKATATSGSSARGDTYNTIFLDEFAFVPTHIADKFLKSVIPTVSSGKDTKVLITSTPQGLNMFYNMWQGAVKGVNDFTPIAVEWNEVPGRDEAWKKKTIEQYGQEFFNQEFACAFLGSSRTLIAADKLMVLQVEEPVHRSEKTRVYEMPEKGHSYAITVDVAEGLGGDSSAIVVTDITTVPYRVACVYQNNLIDQMALPGVIMELGRAYNQAMVLVEANFGGTVASMLYQDFEYEHVIFTSRTSKRSADDQVSGGITSRPGILMNPQSKRIGCSNLKSLIENDQLLIRDAAIYAELCRFAVKGKSYAAEDGHDDLAMCLVMFAWLVDQGYVKDATSQNVRARIAEMNRRAVEDDVMSMGFIVDQGVVDTDTPVIAKKGWLSFDDDPEPDPRLEYKEYSWGPT